MSGIGSKIRVERNKHGWTQVELANKMNLSKQTINNWEHGRRIPDIETLFRDEYQALDELQKHCLFLFLMVSEKDETEIVESMMWTFEEEMCDWGRTLINKLKELH